MRHRAVLDVSDLPMHGLEAASPTWWGTFGFMLLEGTGFALVIAIYLYLLSLAPQWPIGAQPPRLGPGTILTVILVISIVPNYWILKWARERDLRKVRVGIVVMSLLGIAPIIPRAFEFPALGISWDSNAYGSILWTMLGLHTTHIVTDVADTLVLAALMFTRHGDNPRRFGDVQDNALYWNFVVLTWLPLYICIYWLPRL
ncbi:MAG: cytochrome c oxidase subunit 3 [Hyphomicrobiales bacterium]|nr:cytochrome c oxidase subunit 3 [Hyphomicrobiales bacterium]MBV9111726.1 cytochrome c oxidase subunit 3 [Hyphomicrobiales bacterium]MBV9519650.1 cytochrome c oxidase subunit 3 [Hyphomicrobiales bacterium]